MKSSYFSNKKSLLFLVIVGSVISVGWYVKQDITEDRQNSKPVILEQEIQSNYRDRSTSDQSHDTPESKRGSENLYDYSALRNAIVQSTISRSKVEFDEALEGRRLTIISIARPSDDEIASWISLKDEITETMNQSDRKEIETRFRDDLILFGFSESNYRIIKFRVPFEVSESVTIWVFDRERSPYQENELLGVPNRVYHRSTDDEDWPYRELLSFD